jgi:hypothetical protein
MASIINASSSGSGGIVQTADASGVLQLQSNGTVALSISGAATTFGGNMLLEASGNPSMTVKTTGAGNNPLYRLQADTNYWDVLGVFSDANDTLRIRYNGSDKMILNNGGIVALAGGDSDATGTGITFPATQNASTNANTLDDYEEGTFTPSITFGGNAVGITYGTRVGRYTKIGNCVTFNLYCPMTNKGSSTGIFNIIGLPFTSQNVSAGYNTFTLWTNNTNSTLSGVVQGYVTNGSTAVTFEFQASGFYGAMGALTNTQCNNNSDFMVGGMYFV